MKKAIIYLIVILLFLIIIQVLSFKLVLASKGITLSYIGKDTILLIARVVVEVFVISGLFFLGFWISDRKQQYSLLLNVVLTAYSIFIVQFLIELLWLFFTKGNYSLFEINNFSSLSLLSIMGIEKVPLYLLYPLSVANLWELSFISILSFLLVKRTHVPTKTTIKIVLCSYVLPLICWIAMVSYINMINTI